MLLTCWLFMFNGIASDYTSCGQKQRRKLGLTMAAGIHSQFGLFCCSLRQRLQLNFRNKEVGK